MPNYMFKASYTKVGLEGVLKEGATSRLDAVKKLAQSVGGTLETAYWMFGCDDFVAIMELPDNSAAAAVATRVSASGAASVSTTVLLTAAEIEEAASINVDYRPPGS